MQRKDKSLPLEQNAKGLPPRAAVVDLHNSEEKPAQKQIWTAASPARLKVRHSLLAISFVVCVLLPMLVTAGYLYLVADDQYASTVGFSVRKEQTNSAIDLLGGITQLSGSSSSDTDILYKFIQSQQMVTAVMAKIDLVRMYQNRGDPVFGLGSDTRIEALTNYWHKMVKVYYDGGSGLIEVRVLAFSPEDAHAISEAVFEESSRMINELSAIARADATRYAKEELDLALSQLKEARTAITKFRSTNRIVDPQADIAGQMGLLNTLQEQLAASLIELDMLQTTAKPNDPRMEQAQKRVSVIQDRIKAERERFSDGAGASDGTGERDALTKLIGDYETLAVDQEFAEKRYLTALAAYDASLAEAQRKTRYLATHIPSTLAQTSEFPKRFVHLVMVALFFFAGWAMLALTAYSLRDRR
jgi:capsular polysaccharide transport system permease protein